MTDSTQIYMSSVIRILNSNDHLNTKFSKIKSAYYKIYKTDLNGILNEIKNRRNHVDYIRARI